MSRLLALLAAPALLAGCSTDEPIFAPDLRVDRLQVSEGCYRSCAESTSAIEYAEGMCDGGGTVACGFGAAADRIRIVAHFAGVEVSPELAPPAPRLTMIADEVAEDKTAILDRTTGLVPIYTAVLRAPPRRVDTLSFRVVVVDGYQAEVGDLSVLAPEPKLTVFGCEDGAACARTAGIGSAIATIAVPDGIETVKLLRWLDGEPQDPPRDAVKIVSAGGIATYQASAPIPDHGAIFTLQATAGGYPSTLLPISLSPPSLALDVAGCETSGCARPAGVGKAVVTVTLPSGLGAPALQTSIDGAVQQAAQTTAMIADDGTTSSWQASLPTPAFEGATWCIDAIAGKHHAGAVCITLTAPPIAVEVPGCPAGDICALAAKSKVVIAVTAPKGISPASAILKGTVDGIPLLGQDLPVTLDEQDGDLVKGYAATLVPDSPGKTWQLVAYMSQSKSPPSVPIHIGPAAP